MPAPPAPYDPKATVDVARDEVTFTSGDETVPGTLVHPAKGKWPAIVMFAGSGPTDRDWNNPLASGTNGSGKLFAEELARHGAVVLRFDKSSIGANKQLPEKLAPDTFLDEGRAAVALLRARSDVDPGRIFTLGNSEGGIHAMRTAVAEGAGGVHGVVLLASAGRSMKVTLLGQISAQFDRAVKKGAIPAEVAKAQMEKLAQALDDFLAGKVVDPAAVSPIPGIQQLVAAIVHQDGPGMRALLGTDPVDAAAKIAVPVLVLNGLKDVQIDPERDAKRLVTTLGAHATLVLPPDANHVFKHEPKTMDELHADPKAAQDWYNAAEAVLDQVSVDAIEQWLAEHTR